MGRYVEEISRLLVQGETRRRYCYGSSPGQYRALSRKLHAGQLVSPYRNVYARKEYADSLDPIERSRHLVRTLALMHPGWRFAGISAASMFGFEHGYVLHKDGLVFIAGKESTPKSSDSHLRHIYAPHTSMRVIDGVKVTSVARTLVDCALLYPFEQVLPLFDSALRRGLLVDKEVTGICSGLRCDYTRVLRPLRYADGLSENGGESRCRALLIDSGFVVPRLQREFIDPKTGARYRTDFSWECGNGRIVVLEYDGLEKYVNPEMNHGYGSWQVVNDERARESALIRAGVSVVVRLSSKQLHEQGVPVRRLVNAGVPMMPIWRR